MLGNGVKRKLSSVLIIVILICSGIFITFPLTPMTDTAKGISTWTQTTYDDFNKGTMNNVEINDTGSGIKLELFYNKGWIQKSHDKKPPARMGHAMATIGGTENVLLFGGYNQTMDFDDTWVYYSDTDKWKKMSPSIKPGARSGHKMATIWGTDKVLLFGVDLNNGKNWIYDFSEDQWTDMGTSIKNPGSRWDFGMASIFNSNKVVLFGGEGMILNYFDDTWTYYFNTNTWVNNSDCLNLVGRRNHAMATIYGTNNSLLFGGIDIYQNIFGDTWVYNSTDDCWTKESISRHPFARIDHAMASIHGSDKVMLSGGLNGNIVFGDTWIYDFSDHKWTEKSYSIEPCIRFDHAMASIYGTDKILLFGGNDSTEMLDDTWIYKHFLSMDNGTFISSMYDTGTNSSFKTLNWDADTPSNTSIKFQLRTAPNSWDLNTKTFIGPDGTSATLYTTSSSNIWSGHDGDIHIQYKAYLNTSDINKTPMLKSVTIAYNNLPRTTFIRPSNGTLLSNNKPYFDWGLEDYSEQPISFHVLIHDSDNFNNPLFDSGEISSNENHWQFPDGTSYTHLPDGVWHWKVRVKDSDGDWGPFSPPNIFTIDTTPPDSEITVPLNNKCYEFLDNISGIASDNAGSGVYRLDLMIKRMSDNHCWDSWAWSSNPTWLIATGTTEWVYDTVDVDWVSGIKYDIRSRAIDRANNFEITDTGVNFYIDSEKPSSKIMLPENKTFLNKLDGILFNATDPGGSGVAQLTTSIRRNLDNYYWDGETWVLDMCWLNTTRLKSGYWYYSTDNIEWVNGVQYTINSRAIDTVGNREFPGAKYSFTFDALPPGGLSILINNGSKYTKSRFVSLILQAEDIHSGIADMSFSFDNYIWSDWKRFNSTPQLELPVGDGEKVVYFKAMDYAGNSAEPVYDSIILDTTAPLDLSISINNGSSETNSTNVILKLTANDAHSGVYQMSFSTDNENWTDWEEYSMNKSFILSPGDGEKTIYFKVKDKVGNIAEPIETNITLNTTIPENEEEPEKSDQSSELLSGFPVIWIILIIIVIIVLILIFMFHYRKRREKQQALQPKAITVKLGAKPTRVITVDQTQPIKVTSPPTDQPPTSSQPQKTTTTSKPIVAKSAQIPKPAQPRLLPPNQSQKKQDNK